MLTIAKFDRYDLINNPLDKTASFTIWFSGCTFKCKECYNKQLWDKSFGNSYSPQQVVDIAMNYRYINVNSIVLLGGEPLQQDKEELLSLCRLLYESGMKIWLYTGYDFKDVDAELLKYLYTVKCGRYIDELRQSGFPASSNQQVYRSFAGDWVNITTEIRRTN